MKEKTFDPYTDRMARDIRNSLSEGLVHELKGDGDGSLSTLAKDWLKTAPGPVYHAYIQERMALFSRAIDQIKTGKIVDTRLQSICLWNLGLFFEMHELLETLWHKSQDPERSALKGWIQAAGVYVHFQRGKPEIARKLGRKAFRHLRNGRAQLDVISNIEQLIDALEQGIDVPPKLLPAR